MSQASSRDQERLGVPRKDWVSPEGRGAGTTLTPQSSISARAPGVGAVSETQTPAPHPSESPGQRQPTDQALGHARDGRPASQQGLLLSAQHRAYPEGQGQRAEPWGDGPRATHRLQPPLPRLPAGLPLRQGKSPVTGPGRPGPGGRAGHAQLLFQHMVAVGPGRCSASAPELCGLSCAPTRLAGCSLGSTRPLPHWYTSPNGELTPAAAPPASSQEFVSRASSARGELVPPHPRGPLSELWGRDWGCFQRMALVGGGLQ